MAVVKATESDTDLLARLLRAEAEGEGLQGMLHVGPVGINRIRANCSGFVALRTIPQMVFKPHAFEELYSMDTFTRGQEKNERRLARRAIRGERQWPAKFALWYFRLEGDCPARWYGHAFMSRQEKNVRTFIAYFNRMETR